MTSEPGAPVRTSPCDSGMGWGMEGPGGASFVARGFYGAAQSAVLGALHDLIRARQTDLGTVTPRDTAVSTALVVVAEVSHESVPAPP